MDIHAHGSDTLNRRDAAAFLGVPPDMLRRWERLGIGPAVYRLSSRTARYRVEDLQTFFRASRKGPATSNA